MVLLTRDKHQANDGRSLPAVFAAIWHEAHPYRAAIHRSTRTTRCDLRVDVGHLRIDGDCACRDFLVDMVVECHQYLDEQGGDLANPAGAARIHMRTRAPDWNRRRRSAMGAQCRTDRLRTCARARGLPDDLHRALLEYLVEEAGSMAPLNSQDELFWRLAVRCAGEFSGAPEDYLPRVVAGTAVVERACRAGARVNAGTATHPEYVTWWEMYVVRPLGRRPRRHMRDIPEDAVLDAPESPEDDLNVLDVLQHALRQRPEDPEAALCVGIRDLLRLGLLSDRLATALLADQARLARATAALVELGAR